MEERAKEIQSRYEEAKSAWSGFFTQCQEDWKFKMSDQWSDSDKNILQKKGMPALNINHIFKNINVLSGLQRQNRSDIRVLPIEGSDERTAEVLNMVIKWVMADRNAEFVVSDAFKDSLIGGVGWLHPYVSYDDDPLCGDIIVKKISPFDILPDPHFTERNLSDCDYIIRHRKVSKNKLKRLYPTYAKEIENLKGSKYNNKDFTMNVSVPSDLGNHLLVIELWERDYKNVTLIVNTSDPADIVPWDGTKDELDAFLEQNPDLTAIKGTKPYIKLSVLIEDNLIVYDGPSPYPGQDFPFVPMFCYYESSYSDWTLKLHGVVRPLKDLQREKNKRRSQILAAINTMPSSGWMIEKNAVDDKATLAQAAGAGRIIETNPGKSIQPIQPPDIPASLVQMESMFDNDILIVGNNPDMLGQMAERGAPGITIQLRQKQGLTQQQEIFDSLSDSVRTLGRRLIEIIVNNFSTDKIKRIMGDEFTFTKTKKEIMEQMNALKKMKPVVPDIPVEASPVEEAVYSDADPGIRTVMTEQKEEERSMAQQYAVQQQIYAVQKQMIFLQDELQNVQAEEDAFWAEFEKIKKTARFDVTVDETVGSPTYRASVLAMLTQMQQYGMPVPPELILDYMELSKSAKDKYAKYIQDQQAMMQQQAMMASPKPRGVPMSGGPQ